jgi:hypothetical protein
MIALGAVLPFSSNLAYNLEMFLLFIFLFLAVGSIYGFLVSFYFAILNRKLLLKEFKKQFKSNKIFVLLSSFFALVFCF